MRGAVLHSAIDVYGKKIILIQTFHFRHVLRCYSSTEKEWYRLIVTRQNVPAESRCVSPVVFSLGVEEKIIGNCAVVTGRSEVKAVINRKDFYDADAAGLKLTAFIGSFVPVQLNIIKSVRPDFLKDDVSPFIDKNPYPFRCSRQLRKHKFITNESRTIAVKYKAHKVWLQVRHLKDIIRIPHSTYL